jgi:LytR cell envelope-related transcriptional attenuator
MSQYPRDRFDRAPETLARVGAHRAPRRPGRGWLTFGWAALATLVLIAVGVLGLTQIDRQVADTGATAAPVVTPTVDPQIDVVLLNATTTSGLAARARSAVTAKGWRVVSTANANSTAVATTTVYYTTASQAPAAAGLAKSLGVTRTALSSQFAVKGQSRLTVVLGKDYAATQ